MGYGRIITTLAFLLVGMLCVPSQERIAAAHTTYSTDSACGESPLRFTATTGPSVKIGQSFVGGLYLEGPKGKKDLLVTHLQVITAYVYAGSVGDFPSPQSFGLITNGLPVNLAETHSSYQQLQDAKVPGMNSLLGIQLHNILNMPNQTVLYMLEGVVDEAGCSPWDLSGGMGFTTDDSLSPEVLAMIRPRMKLHASYSNQVTSL